MIWAVSEKNDYGAEVLARRTFNQRQWTGTVYSSKGDDQQDALGGRSLVPIRCRRIPRKLSSSSVALVEKRILARS